MTMVMAMPAQLPDRQEEWTQLAPSDQRLLTPEVIERWTAHLLDEDYTLADLARFEKRRRESLTTLRAGADLTDMEWRLLRYLQRNEHRNVSYLRIARHLWASASNPITPQVLRAAGNIAYEAPLIKQIQTYVCRLRHKIEIDPLRPQHIATIRGVGYRWYSHPPALDDGENYQKRELEIERDRAEMQAVLGLVEGEFTVIQALDRDGQPYETRVWFGPEHRDGRAQLASGEPDHDDATPRST
jgi:hypothetical protein